MSANDYSVRYGHTLPDAPPSEWEPLEDHLAAVATRAAEFGGGLGINGVDAWAETLGRWHDLGKYATAFQAKLYDPTGVEAHLEGGGVRVNHSAAGAIHAVQSVPVFGRLIAYAIAGHHTGLGDAEKLSVRLAEPVHDWREHAPTEWLAAPSIGPPPVSIEHRCGKRLAFQAALFTRMLFSCLVDADRLETERFCDPAAAARRTPPPPLDALSSVLTRRLDALVAGAAPTQVNSKRGEVLEACRAAAAWSPGLFSLSVPTGGGKTFASLDFALRHAIQHDLRRVIVAIPFTSIIEQTAAVYRGVFGSLGDGAVLEHHSNVDPVKETWRNRLAAENWDAPLVVTTNVQLLETLFASRTTPCRKLHRIAQSVIVLDEAQTLPVGLLKPCLAALRELVTDYGCSIVLCTATQPALERRDDFPIGLNGVREIIPQPERLHAAMKRVACENLGPVDDDTLVERLKRSSSWLTIVNTKGHAAGLYRRLAGTAEAAPDDLFHLSTLMCGQHRHKTLTKIRARLKSGLPCRVVSTQLVEAGVDLDFPEVFRAMAGVDSIAQAAGRCNREGRLATPGRLWLFDPTDHQPGGYLGATAATTRELLPDFPDPLDPAAVRRYFESHYWKRSGDHAWDDPRVMDCFKEGAGLHYDFETAAERFRLIDDAAETVFVPYGKGADLIARLRRGEVDRLLLRKLGRYGVGLYPWQCQALVTDFDQTALALGYRVLDNWSLYDDSLGLLVDRPGFLDAERSVI